MCRYNEPPIGGADRFPLQRDLLVGAGSFAIRGVARYKAPSSEARRAPRYKSPYFKTRGVFRYIAHSLEARRVCR